MPPEASKPCALEAFVPRFDFEQVQALRIEAPAPLVFDWAAAIVPEDVPGWKTLFWMRSLPARLGSGTGAAWGDGRPVLSLDAPGVTLLADHPPHERVLGLVGRFWEPSGGLNRRLNSAPEFVAFDAPGFAKAAISLEVEPLGSERCRATTRTRIVATSDDARRRFGLYWALIRPGSALLRWAFLTAVRDRAEAAATEPAEVARSLSGF